MVNKYCSTCQHERNSIGFCDKCCYSRLCEEKGLAPTMYEKRPSNADRLRAMSDEELAEWIGWVTQDAFCYGAGLRDKMILYPFGAAESTMAWLKQEIEE